MSRALLPAALLLCGLLAPHAVFAATRTVTNTADSGEGTLREQLTLAQAGDVIAFDGALFDTPKTIELLTALPALVDNLTLQGPGANLLTLRRADAAPNFRILHATQTLGFVEISGMTIANGYAAGNDFQVGDGGGVLVERRFVIDGVHITGNRADGSGAGMLTNTVGGSISNSTFSNNATGPNGGGGGLFIQPAATPVRIVNSTFSGNSALTGGAIQVLAFLDFAAPGDVELVGVTIHGNRLTAPVGTPWRAALRVSALGGSSTHVTLRNTLFSGNDGLPIDQGASDGNVSITSDDFNLSDIDTGYLDGANDLPGAHPGLAPLADNGGPTPTHALTWDSDAIDAGSNEGSVILTDQRGFARTIDLPLAQLGDSDATDIGAFELQDDMPPSEPDIFGDQFEGE